MEKQSAGHVRRTRKQLQHTAIHEAAHAVIGRVLGLRTTSASIVADVAEMEAGNVVFEDRYDTLARWWETGRASVVEDRSVARARLIATMAGAEAEYVLLGRRAIGDGDDRYQIVDYLCGLVGAEAPAQDRLDKQLRAITRHLVRRHRQAIERVATALIARRRLASDELDELQPLARSVAPGAGITRPVTLNELLSGA